MKNKDLVNRRKFFKLYRFLVVLFFVEALVLVTGNIYIRKYLEKEFFLGNIFSISILGLVVLILLFLLWKSNGNTEERKDLRETDL